MKSTLKKLLGQTGLSAVELLVGLGVMGGVSLMVAKNMQSQNDSLARNEQMFAVETAVNSVAQALKKRSACEAALLPLDIGTMSGTDGANLSKAEVRNFSSLAAGRIDSGIELDTVNAKLDGTTGKVGLNLDFNFKRVNQKSASANKELKRDIKLEVFINDGVISCEGYGEAEIVDSALEKICISLGGVFNAATSKCSVNTITPVLRKKIGESMCEGLNKSGAGSLDASSKCPVIDVEGNIENRNLAPTKIIIGAQERNKFDNQECSGYLKGYSVAGDRSCAGIVYTGASSPEDPVIPDPEETDPTSPPTNPEPPISPEPPTNPEPPAACEETAWLPASSGRCKGDFFTQTSNCATTRENVEGTQDCNENTKNCRWKRPMTVTFESPSQKLGACHCTEGRSGSQDGVMADGKRMRIDMGCDVYSNDVGGTLKGSGSAMFSCNNGKLDITDGDCKASMID